MILKLATVAAFVLIASVLVGAVSSPSQFFLFPFDNLVDPVLAGPAPEKHAFGFRAVVESLEDRQSENDANHDDEKQAHF
jgi:hypothetical protein